MLENVNEVYSELKNKIDKLEYTEIKSIKEDINEIKLTLTTNDLLTKQNMETNEKLANTMETMRNTMIEITQSLKDSNKISSELTKTVENLNEKIDDTNNKMDKKFKDFDTRINVIDDKAKVDWQQFVKNKWFEILLALGALSYVISQLIK